MRVILENHTVKAYGGIAILKIIVMFYSFVNVYPQQINIGRIEAMPNIPSPYLMRDWKAVAIGYDSLVFNINAKGDYLPLIFFTNSTVNYPGEQSFSLHSYVGTKNTTSGETINVLPSIVGATLVGIDKQNRNGFNWVRMSREYFNKRPEMNIYKNSPNNNTFDDWWYESMPNVFFYQLYSLYPTVEDYDYQFISVADRFLEVAGLSGGNTTPWMKSNFSFRGWDFVNKQPYKLDVEEPEAAGAVGWILYNAYVKSGEKKYLIGAEWCMEFLNSLSANPAYEIQLPYGVYTAARMNAEIGTDYDISRMLNWCFSITFLRQWNVLLGKWGVYDINGLIGEDSERQYAFAMNTFQQIGALVPLARYDERFARTIGKWVLNAANSARLFYSKYLDDFRQDSESWSQKYDHNSNIAYEALLKSNSGWPEATGDAKTGGWAETNLSLYSSSSVGYLAGILDTTNVPKILKLNLNKTDFFQNKSYPSFLFFNPYEVNKNIEVKLPSGNFDVYESVTNQFVAQNVSTIASIGIPANSAAIIVLTPPSGKIEHKLKQLLIDGIVVDYDSGVQVSNYPPRVKSLSPISSTIVKGKSTKIYCTATDKDSDQLIYKWKAARGIITGESSTVDFTAPNDTGTVGIEVIIEDSKAAKDTAIIFIKVVEQINHSPQINYLKASPRKINIGENAAFICNAFDKDSDALNYSWSSKYGAINQIKNDSAITWIAPLTEGDYYIKCRVSDNQGVDVIDSIKVMVRDFKKYTVGNLVAFYPFNGNAYDENGGGNNGIITGAVFINDRFNNSSKALRFNGKDDKVQIKNSSSINFQNAISLSFWMQLDQLPTKESYIISHGSYDKRFKASISNGKLRWTIKTDKTGNNILDLDSESPLDANKLYNCVVTYNGADVEIWINGELNSFTTWSGKLLTSNVDLTIAQMLPSDANYNFKGVLDDFRIYDYALLPNSIKELDDIHTSVEGETNIHPLPSESTLGLNFPNPFNMETVITFKIANQSHVGVYIYDILGRKVKTLVDKLYSPGAYQAIWDGTSDSGKSIASGLYVCIMNAEERISKLKLVLLK